MALNVILLIAGAIVFIVSFIMPEMGSELDQVDSELTQGQIREMINKEMSGVREQVSEIVEETSNYSVEKTERALERLTNEKISAVSEYSDTVMEDIHKSHEEVMFLYDMLNNKHEDLKETASEVSTSVQEARRAQRELEESVSAEAAVIAEEKAAADTDEEDTYAQDDPDDMTESFHSETARDFFARHEESNPPSIEDIRASFQPMAFGHLSEVSEDERVFGSSGEGREEAGDDLAKLDDAQVDAAIDELLGVGEKAEDTPTEEIPDSTVNADGPLDTEAAMDAALAALTGNAQSIKEENEMAAVTAAGTAMENELASAKTAAAAMENDLASDENAGIAMENDAALTQPEVFRELTQSISAMVKDQENRQTPYAVDESAVDDLIPEKAPRSGKKSKAGKGKDKPADITLQFGMDEKGSGNNNERILALYKKGKSNIAIAKELGLGVGEVKLVLDLFKGM